MSTYVVPAFSVGDIEEQIQKEILQLSSEIEKTGVFEKQKWMKHFAAGVSNWKIHQVKALIKNKTFPIMKDSILRAQIEIETNTEIERKQNYIKQKIYLRNLISQYIKAINRLEIHLQKMGYNLEIE